MPLLDHIAGLSGDEKLLVEQALRTGAANIGLPTNAADAEALIKKKVSEELGAVVGGNFGKAFENKEMAAVALTAAFMGAMKVRAVALDNARQEKNKRNALREQIDHRYASFTVPTHDNLWDEQAFIRDLMRLVTQTEREGLIGLRKLLGIETITPQKSGEPTVYQVFPFYRDYTGVNQEASSRDALSTARVEINAHLTITLRDLFESISKAFRSGTFLGRNLSAFRKKDNYLNKYNQARFVLMMLGNLLWNLQHPMNLESRVGLNFDECIALCNRIEIFLTTICAENMGPRLKAKVEEPWVDFLRTSKALVFKLKCAYEEEKLKTFTIKPLATSARETVKMTVKALFELLYQHHDELSDRMVSDVKTAERLVEILRALRNTLSKNTKILAPFLAHMGSLPDDPALKKVLNASPQTVLDILIIYSHLPSYERNKIKDVLRGLAKEDQNHAGVFFRALLRFDEGYIRTLNKVLKTSPRAGYEAGSMGRFSHESERLNRARLIGRRFTPCLVLLIDTYQVDVDTATSMMVVTGSQSSSDNSPDDSPADRGILGTEHTHQKTGKEQVALINDLNRASEEAGPNVFKPYFYWHITPLLDTRKSFARKINKLVPSADQMTGIAELLEALDELIENYRSVLQNQEFLNFLDTCITAVNKAQTNFKVLFQGAETKLGGADDQLKCILFPIIDRLKRTLGEFTVAAQEITDTISDPAFKEREHGYFKERIQFIDSTFMSLFGDEFDTPQGTGPLESIFYQKKGCPQRKSKLFYATVSPGFPRSPRKASSFSNLLPPIRTFTQSPFTQSPLVRVDTYSDSDSESEHDRGRAQELKAFSLLGLIDICHDSMSYWSQWGHKGQLHKTLRQQVEKQTKASTSVGPSEFKGYIRDLFRIAFSYRRNYLRWFQADYADSKSAKALIRAMRDPKVNLVLPLAEVLLGDSGSDLSKMSDGDIMKAAVRLRDLEEWEFAAGEIRGKSLQCVNDVADVSDVGVNNGTFAR